MSAPFQEPGSSRIARRAQRALREGDLDKAERFYDAALQERPDDFDALHGLGEVNLRRGCLDQALVRTQAALRADPRRAEGFATLGLVFHAMRRFTDALTSFEEGLRLTPDDAELLNRRGVALLELRRPHDAVADFERALSINPARLDALGNLGNGLLKLNRPAEALSAYDRALAFAPNNAQLLTNRAVALRRLDRPREALMSAAKALAMQPDFLQARFVEALARLTLGDFAAGWRGYEARWGVGLLSAQRRNFAAPLWSGSAPLDGKTILLHAEQGSGDTIQFARYAPLVAACGAKALLEVQPELAGLMHSLKGVAAVIARGSQLPHFDCHCPLLSLPLAFATELATIPASIPYLAPAERDVARRHLTPRQKPLVGLAWSGARIHDNDLNRSIRLETLAPLFDDPSVQFVSLQHEVREEDAPFLRAHARMLHVCERFSDFADTAAVVAQLDAVVSVDSVVAHLAGAMGKPLMLLLPFAADFRWLRERADSPWYPTARLFRQPRFGDWESVLAALVAELKRFSSHGTCSGHARLCISPRS